MSHPLQVTVHDWVKPGGNVTVWTAEQGHLCPELETPEQGNVVLYVNYDLDADDTLIQAHIELSIDALGYPAGSRWIGRSAKDADAVVSLVGVFPAEEIDQHIKRVESVVSREFLAVFDGREYQALSFLATVA
jgi:hypothetical protein